MLSFGHWSEIFTQLNTLLHGDVSQLRMAFRKFAVRLLQTDIPHRIDVIRSLHLIEIVHEEPVSPAISLFGYPFKPLRHNSSSPDAGCSLNVSSVCAMIS